MTLDLSRPWESLTDEERRSALLAVWGYAPRGMGYWYGPNNEYVGHFLRTPNPLTDPGAAMDLLIWANESPRRFDIDLTNVEAPPASGSKIVYFCRFDGEVSPYTETGHCDTPMLAISEAVYRAAQARAGSEAEP